MASAEGVVLPKPAIPKTLGILNVIFAVLLILMGLCVGGMTIIAPQIQKFGQGVMDQAKAQAETQKAADLKTLDDRAQAATTDEEKATIAQERDAVVNRQAPVTINVTASTDVLKNPTVLGFTVTQVITGLILHIALLVAGIGLIRLTPWGRTLTLWWAGLQIAQLLILAAINFTMILPIQQQAAAANMAELKKQLTGPNAPPNAAITLQTAEVTSNLATIGSVVGLLIGLTYPVICLILLQTAGARAACLGQSASKDLSADFPPPAY